MPLYDHALRGCTPRPLSSYLKAIAILRLVVEQVDETARGYWDDDSFHLLTSLDERELVDFFLKRWQPSPMVSPWNKASGFFSSTDKGLEPVEKSTAERFGPLRKGIQAARRLLEEMDNAVREFKAVQEEPKRLKNTVDKNALRNDPHYKQRLAQADRRCKALKDDLQPRCLMFWRGSELQWLRAAVVIDGTGKPKFPALLGTGGNDGNLDFSNNAYQRLGDLFQFDGEGSARPGAEVRLRATLWGEPAVGLAKGAIGQFAPAHSGGVNATSGTLGESLLNSWDLPLLLEGSMLFVAGTSRRLQSHGGSLAVAPFAVRGQAAGYASASRADEGVRGEQWMPLWTRPWTLSELKSVLSEGRAQIQAGTSESSLDLAKAIARLGVARGIDRFERYGYLERNGKSNYAVPLGRWYVSPNPDSSVLDDLDAGDWLSRVRRAARSDRAPKSFATAERLLTDSIFRVLANPKSSELWSQVLIALAKLEAQMVLSGKFTVQQRLSPIPPLSNGWVSMLARSPSSETRLALCLAGAGIKRDKLPFDSVRRHWLPLQRRNDYFAISDKDLVKDPRVVVSGRDGMTDLLAIVERRLIESQEHRFPLSAKFRFPARQLDLLNFVSGSVDVAKVVWLARSLAALRWNDVDKAVLNNQISAPGGALSPAYMALRLAHLPPIQAKDLKNQHSGDLLERLQIPVDPAPCRLLCSGSIQRAFEIVFRRLRSKAILPPLRVVALERQAARLYVASLAFPIGANTALNYCQQLSPTPETKEHP